MTDSQAGEQLPVIVAVEDAIDGGEQAGTERAPVDDAARADEVEAAGVGLRVHFAQVIKIVVGAAAVEQPHAIFAVEALLRHTPHVGVGLELVDHQVRAEFVGVIVTQVDDEVAAVDATNDEAAGAEELAILGEGAAFVGVGAVVEGLLEVTIFAVAGDDGAGLVDEVGGEVVIEVGAGAVTPVAGVRGDLAAIEALEVSGPRVPTGAAVPGAHERDDDIDGSTGVVPGRAGGDEVVGGALRCRALAGGEAVERGVAVGLEATREQAGLDLVVDRSVGAVLVESDGEHDGHQLVREEVVVPRGADRRESPVEARQGHRCLRAGEARPGRISRNAGARALTRA